MSTSKNNEICSTHPLINTYVLSLAIDFVEIASISFLAPLLTLYLVICIIFPYFTKNMERNLTVKDLMFHFDCQFN